MPVFDGEFPADLEVRARIEDVSYLPSLNPS